MGYEHTADSLRFSGPEPFRVIDADAPLITRVKTELWRSPFRRDFSISNFFIGLALRGKRGCWSREDGEIRMCSYGGGMARIYFLWPPIPLDPDFLTSVWSTTTG